MKDVLKAVIFDFDGTIADTERIYIDNFISMIEDYGLSFDEDDKRHMVGCGYSEKAEYVTKKYHVDIRNEEEDTALFRKLNADNIPKDPSCLLYDDVIPAFQMIRKKGLKIFLCSNTPSDRIEKIVTKMGIISYIDEIFGKDKFLVRKPSSVAYEYILKTKGLNKDEVIAIEDSKGGIKSAKGAGIYAIGLCRVSLPEDLNADIHISDLNELKMIL